MMEQCVIMCFLTVNKADKSNFNRIYETKTISNVDVLLFFLRWSELMAGTQETSFSLVEKWLC